MTQSSQTHEIFSSRTEIKVGSDRSFGLVFATIFILIALAPLLKEQNVRWWAVIVAAVLFLIALAAPNILFPLNNIWFRFGLVLHKIMSPVLLGFVFFIIFTPVAYILRALRKPPLALSFDHAMPSYWIARTPPGPASQSMKRQF